MIKKTKHTVVSRVLSLMLIAILLIPLGIQITHVFSDCHNHYAVGLDNDNLQDNELACGFCKVILNVDFIEPNPSNVNLTVATTALLNFSGPTAQIISSTRSFKLLRAPPTA